MWTNIIFFLPTCYTLFANRLYIMLHVRPKKCLCKLSKVFCTPKCPIKPPSWVSCTSNSQTEQTSTHNLSFLNRKPSCWLEILHQNSSYSNQKASHSTSKALSKLGKLNKGELVSLSFKVWKARSCTSSHLNTTFFLTSSFKVTTIEPRSFTNLW